MKFVFLTVLVVIASCIEAKSIPEVVQQRDLADFVANQLGLGAIWPQIQNLGGTLAQEIFMEGFQLIMAGGKQKLDAARQIFAKLVDDLTNHGIQSLQTATEMVKNAIKEVASLIKGSQKRDVADFLLNTIGLQGVWEEIQNLGATFVTQILNEAMQLVFAGQDKLKEAKEIFAQLAADLTSHTGNAATIVQNAINMVAEILKKPTQQRAISDLIVSTLGLDAIWGQIQTLGNGFVSQIISEGMQLVFAGQEKLNAAKAVFAKLVDELTNHGIQTAQIAASMVKDAIREVANILSGSQKRDLADFIVNQLGLGAVWQEIQALGNGTVEQIVQEGLALLLSGKDVLEQAKEIFKQLVKDLLAHSQTTSSLVSTAIAAVAELLKKPQQL